MKDKKSQKIYNGGQWTTARKRSFIMSALRRAQWGVKYACIKASFVEMGVNPDTGRKCKMHRCALCNGLFKASDMQADHIEPVVPVSGFDSWDKVIERLFCEVDGFQAVCKPCHKTKSLEENAARREWKHEKPH